MNWRTTAVLFVIVVILGGYLYFQNQQEPEEEPLPTAVPTTVRVELMSDVTSDQIRRLEVRDLVNDSIIAFEKQDDGSNWSRTVPTNTLAISQTLMSKFTSLVNMTSRQSIPLEQNPLSAYGLDQPSYEFIISLQPGEGESNVRYTFLIGEKTPTGNAFYVQRQGDPRIHVVLDTTIDNILELLTEPPLVEATPTPPSDA